MAQEPAPTILIRHMFGFAYLIGTSPTAFKFDMRTGKYDRIGGRWRKIVCLAFVVLATIQYEAQDRLAQPEPGAENKKGEIMLRKLLGYTYKCFIASLYWALYIKVPRKVEILNGMVGKYRQFHAHGGVHSKSKFVWISAAIIVLTGVTALGETFGGLNRASNGKPVVSLRNVLDIHVRQALLLLGNLNNATGLPEYCFSCEQSSLVANVLGALSFLWLLWVELCWTCGASLTICWAISMWSLLSSFHAEILCKKKIGLSMKSGEFRAAIQTFNEICSLVEKLNQVCGWTILFTILAGIIHLSVHVFTIFKEDAETFEKIGLLSTFVGFGAELWVTAMVHHEAKNIGRTLKSQFEAVVSELVDSERTAIQGALVLLLQDLNAGNVGIKGHEFFTCTFGFIGTVLGTIATYSFIVIQLQG